MANAPLIAKFDGKCQDRCGLRIHAGHDEIERGHFGFRHVDCERAHAEAMVRERVADGWGTERIWAWLNNSPDMTFDQKLDAIAYAGRELGARLEDAA